MKFGKQIKFYKIKEETLKYKEENPNWCYTDIAIDDYHIKCGISDFKNFFKVDVPDLYNNIFEQKRKFRKIYKNKPLLHGSIIGFSFKLR